MATKEKKEVLAYIFTDLHLNDVNKEVCIKFIDKMIEGFKKDNPTFIIFVGDLYDIRAGLTDVTLKYGKEIFKKIKNLGRHNYWVVGNHDKFIQTSENNYLKVYEEFTTEVYSEVGGFSIPDWNKSFLFFPYFEGEPFQEQLKKLIDIAKENYEKKRTVLLFAHYMYEDLPAELTQYCDKIYLGHNHERQEFPKGMYLGSCIQREFCEDKYKGYNILYSDLSLKQVLFEDKEYVIQSVDLNTFTEEELKNFILKFREDNPNKYLRIELKGFSKDVSQIKEFCKQYDISCVSKVDNTLQESFFDIEGEITSELTDQELEKYYNNYIKNQNIKQEVEELLREQLFKKKEKVVKEN